MTCIIVCGVALYYLSQWLNMPLYPDEVAFRLLRSRYLADGNMAYGLLPCASNARPIAFVFRPVAYALSVVDFGLGWTMLRYIQVAGVMLVLLTTLLVAIRRDAIAAALITAVALLGVVGSGLILSRGEAPMLFLGAACVAGYWVVTQNRRGIAIHALYLAVTTCLALLAMFVHQQALILLPILVLLLIATVLRTRSVVVRALAGLSGLVMLAGAAGALTTSQIKCPEFPAVAPVFARMELGGLARQEGWQGVETYLLEKLPQYAGHFGFNTEYASGYLPGIDPALYGEPLYFLNAGIEYAVLLNLILAFVVMIVFGIRSLRTLVRGAGPFRDRVVAVLLQPSIYIALGIAGHLLLFIYDVPNAFYRNFHIHFVLVMLNVIALSGIRGRVRMLLWPFAIASIILCVASAFLSREMDGQFSRGWVGPSLPLHTDWVAVGARVRGAAEKCNIGTRDARIIIDDLTFDGMKRHPHLIPISYIGFALPPKDSDAASLSRFFRHVPATAVVARCASLRDRGLAPEYENDGICCLKLPLATGAR